MNSVIAYFEQVDPKLAPLVAAGFAHTQPIKLPAPMPPSTYFHELAESIVSQQLSVKAAKTIWKRLLGLLGGEATPIDMLKQDIDSLRSVGLSRQKAGYLLAMAEGVRNGSVKLQLLSKMSDEDVITELIKLKGVGIWTAEMFLMFTLGRPDVFSYLDLGLIRAFEQVYGYAPATRQSMEPIVMKWKPYRSYAALALWHSRDH